MVQIAGKYETYKNENLAEFLVALRLPEERAKAIAAESVKLEFQLDGKKVVVISSGADSSTTTYILDEVVDEVVGANTYKTTTVLNGDVLTVTAAKGDVKLVRSFKFSDNETVLTLSGSGAGNVTAKRFFKRL